MKFLWRLPDGLAIESVWIPDGRRTTLCISSQAGCAYGCTFCATGRMGFQRHLEPWEIAAQVRAMALDPDFGRPSNIVFMGMGEPLHNWQSVDAALTILNDPRGFGIGARHITVSTVGL
ncbi:MAG: radical SAM protein, partial [Akkermansiaceae bacterium]|nr:radical SAM protein [Akkermansiaceae bacterium]